MLVDDARRNVELLVAMTTGAEVAAEVLAPAELLGERRGHLEATAGAAMRLASHGHRASGDGAQKTPAGQKSARRC